MMLFALGGNLVNTIIQNLKDYISTFSTTKEGTTFEAESCLNNDLTLLSDYELLDSSDFIITPNNYSESRIIPVIPLPDTNPDFRNLLWRSEGKTTSWLTQGSTSALFTGTTDPFGGLKAVRVIETALTAAHNTSQAIQNYIAQNGAPFVLSSYLKKGIGAAAPDIMQLSYGNSFANFNITAGTVTFSGSVTNAGIENAGGGWYRCIMSGNTTGLVATNNNPQIFIGFVNNNPTATARPSYAGATTRDVFIYGSQFELSTSATTYQNNDLYPQLTNGFGMFLNTTFLPYRTNSSALLQNIPYENIIYPSVGVTTLSNGLLWRWLHSALGTTTTGILAPDGSLTGSRISLGAGTTRPDYYFTYQTSGTNAANPSFSIPKIRTLILYVKQDLTDRYLGIRLNTGSNVGSYNDNTVTIKIDCSNGTLANNPTAYSISYSSQSVGNGWYKVCINRSSVWDSMLFQSSATLNTVNNTANAGVLIWGIQVVDGTADINTPIYNRDLGYSIPRLDYSGSSCPTYLIETSNFNTLLQSDNFTSANWIKSSISATTSTFLSPDNNSYSNVLIATGSNGIIRQSGSANSTARQRIFSVFLQRKNGSGPVSISMGSITSTVTLTNSWQRYFVVDPLRTGTYTSTSGNFTVTTSVAHGYQTGDAVFIDFTTGAAADSSISSITVTGPTTFTFTVGTSTTSGNCTIYSNTGKILIDTLGDEVYAWGAQIDSTLGFATSAGRVPSSYIPTTTVQVSRASDFFACNLSGGSTYSLYIELSRIGGANSNAFNYLFLGNEASIGLSRDGIALAGTLNGGIIYSKKENNGATSIISNPLLYTPAENRSSKVLFTISGTTLNLWMDGTLINTNTFAVPSNLRYLIIDGGSSSTVRLSNIATWVSTLNTTQAQTLTYNPYFTNGTTELTFVLGRARSSGLAVPSDSTLQALDTFISSLKASGTWDKMDAIYNFAYNDTNVAAFSRLNLKNTFDTLASFGTGPTISVNGIIGSSSPLSNHYRGFTPTVDNVNYQLDSNSITHIFFQTGTTTQVESNTVAGSSLTFYLENSTAHRNNSNVALNSAVDLTGIGLKSMNRIDSTNITFYNQSTPYNRTQTRNITTGVGQQQFPISTNMGISFSCYGSPLTQTDIDTLRTAYNTYLSAIGLTPFA